MMSELSEMMLDGTLCESCGKLLPAGMDDKPPGYPCKCAKCKFDSLDEESE